jgi:excisionase family DNA binding protein
MVKKLKLPDWAESDIGPITLPEFAPNQTTMAQFDADPSALWRACSEWWRTLRKDPHITDPEYQLECGFDQLTAALMLWASTHGLGSGMELADAAAGGDIWRAQAFLDAMRNRAQIQTTAAADGPPAASRAAKEPRVKGGLTVREVARHYLRVNPDKVYAWIRSGELAAMNTSTVPGRKRWIISLEALAEFQARRKPETPPKLAPRCKRRPQMRDYYA